MKLHQESDSRALTKVEVLIIIAAVCLLAVIFLPALAKAKARSSKIACVNHLKQIVLSFKIWSGDNADRFPMHVAGTNGGAMEWVASGQAWPLFQTLSNELNTPKILVCPQDPTRFPATNFLSAGMSPIADFDNSHISYFLGVDAEETRPTMLLAGDSNLEVAGTPVKSGLLNLWTNSAAGWTKERHQKAGNIGLADGSVSQFSNPKFREVLANTGVATNRLAIP